MPQQGQALGPHSPTSPMGLSRMLFTSASWAEAWSWPGLSQASAGPQPASAPGTCPVPQAGAVLAAPQLPFGWGDSCLAVPAASKPWPQATWTRREGSQMRSISLDLWYLTYEYGNNLSPLVCRFLTTWSLLFFCLFCSNATCEITMKSIYSLKSKTYFPNNTYSHSTHLENKTYCELGRQPPFLSRHLNTLWTE